MTTTRARTAFGLLLGGLAVAVASGAATVAGVATVAADPAPAGSIASPPSVVPPAIKVMPSPCSPRPSDSACTVAPRTLFVTLPTGTEGVNVTWTTTGRPPSTPGPAKPAKYLQRDGACRPTSGAAPATCSWPWPRELEATGSTVVLNGTYQVAPCSAPPSASDLSTCTPPPASPSPAHLGIVAPPAPPGNVRVSSSPGLMTVSWALGAEPDLAGYTVTRNNVVISTCSLHGAP
ncbi:MAG: hypothetical protein M3063_09605, partial [Actinomycetota bacterium]|nr:hypothetical protein [Actinomycetota bacterium]